MKLDKNDFNIFLEHWINGDPELWAELELKELDVLRDRIVYELDYEQLSAKYKITALHVRRVIKVILKKIEMNISERISHHLRYINNRLDGKASSPLDDHLICLN